MSIFTSGDVIHVTLVFFSRLSSLDLRRYCSSDGLFYNILYDLHITAQALMEFRGICYVQVIIFTYIGSIPFFFISGHFLLRWVIGR